MTPATLERLSYILQKRTKQDFLGALIYRTIYTPEDTIITDCVHGLRASAVLASTIRYANYFHNIGITRGDIVGIQCSDRLRLIVVNAALLAIGAVRKPLSIDELSDYKILGMCKIVLSENTPPSNLAFTELITLDNTLDNSIASHVITPSSLDSFVEDFKDEDPIMLGSTSSTTGEKKYFFNTYEIIKQRTLFIGNRYFNDGTSNFISLYDDANGSTHVASIAALLAGGSIVLANLESLNNAINKFSNSHSIILPRDLISLIAVCKKQSNETNKNRLNSIRALGGALSENQRDWLLQNISREVINSYSSNETGQIAEVDPHGIGKIYPQVYVRITDEHNNKLPNGTPGLISIRAPASIKSYLWDKQLNDRSFDGEWFLSNDCGIMLGPNTIQLLGRADEMLNCGGLKISPVKYEQQIRDIDSVTDCALFVGNTNDALDAVIVCIQTKSGFNKNEIRTTLSKIISPIFGDFKLVFFDHFPETETAKTKRRVLFQMAQEVICAKSPDKFMQ